MQYYVPDPPPPVRLGYCILLEKLPKGASRPQKIKVCVTYESGRTKMLPGRFHDTREAQDYVALYYPELIGKCGGIASPECTTG